MNQPILVFDAHYICHRAFHSASRGLSFGNKATGVIYGFFRTWSAITREFCTQRAVFCFEGQTLKRRLIDPDYKIRHAKSLTPMETRDHKEMHDQLRALRDRYLLGIGFKNVFHYDGYESDDIMAAIAFSMPEDQKVILVTSDSDLYQCLRPNVSIYSPHKSKLLTYKWFRETYQISPHKWAVVKALSGCHGDNVRGIRGVGEVTALRYLTGTLKPGKAYDSIRSVEAKEIVRVNRMLVELPFKGCPVPTILDDKISPSAWNQLCFDLGMTSMLGLL